MILHLRNFYILEWRVCVCLCLSLSHSSMRQWARREAERLILQREKAGLPLIEENYYDPNTILQPTPKES